MNLLLTLIQSYDFILIAFVYIVGMQFENVHCIHSFKLREHNVKLKVWGYDTCFLCYKVIIVIRVELL